MFSSLRNKILIPTLLLLLVGMGSISAISYWQGSSILKQAIYDDASGSSSGVERVVNVLIENAEDDLAVLAGRSQIIGSLTPGVATEALHTETTAILKNLSDLQRYYSALAVLSPQGEVVVSSAPVSKGTSFSGQPFFNRVRSEGKPAFSVAYVSPISKTPTVTVAVPVYGPNRSFLGVLCADFDLKMLSEGLVKNIRLGQRGYAFILEKGSGNIICHADPSKIMDTSLSQQEAIRTLASKSDSSSIQVTQNGKEIYYDYEPVERINWVVVVTAEVDDFLGNVYYMRDVSIGLAAAIIVIVGLVIFMLVRNIVGALGQGVTFADAVAHGDLKRTLDVYRKDELGLLSDSLRTMVGNLQKMIATSEEKTAEATAQSAKAQAAMAEAETARIAADNAKREGLHQAGEHLGVIVDQATRASDLLLRNVHDAASGTDQQRHRTTEIATAMEEMNATVYEVARNAGSAAESADEARKNATEGEHVVADVVSAIAEVDAKTTDLKTRLNHLGEQAQGIGRIMNVITDIADQTNLLALNAAIEAARAGEAGRGFAVVADEVRKLAEKTMTATKEVGDAVKAIQSGTQVNIRGMEDASVSVGRSTSMAKEAGQSLQAILHIAEATADKVRSIATASEQQSAASEEINRGTEEINRVADETAVLMRESTEVVEELMELIRQIHTIVEEFKAA